MRRVVRLEGPEFLTDAGLLGTMLGACTGESPLVDLAGEILAEAGGVAGLADVTCAELCAIPGVGDSRTALIMCAVELGRRALRGSVAGERLSSSGEVYRLFWPWMVRERAEVFGCAMVDSKLGLIRTEVISRGTLTASIVHPREAFRPAVRNAASGVIFAHNHPSGDPQPSGEDRRITGRLEEVGRILGIPVLDHVVIGAEGLYYSFADAGALEPQPDGYRGMVLR